MSWEPLDVYVFDACYLKICGSEFDLRVHDDILRHLSNYSLQKGGKDLVMSSAEFEHYMRESQDPDFTWSQSMLPQIESVIWRTLKSV
jgi:predicted class III extradiol MEMO1 family dioxygenase